MGGLAGQSQSTWTDRTGHRLVVINYHSGHPGAGDGVVHDGRYTPIPFSINIFDAAW